jgi:NAD(P)H-nitrite reductase large subunit
VVKLDSGASVAYDKLLIATGGRNRRFSIPGLDLKGVHDLRTVADCEHIRTQIAPGRKAVVVGMGFIGSEVAASLRQSGVDVVVVERNKVPLRRVLGEEVGRVIEGVHRDYGATLIFDDTELALLFYDQPVLVHGSYLHEAGRLRGIRAENEAVVVFEFPGTRGLHRAVGRTDPTLD